MKKLRALISVSDKTNLKSLAEFLSGAGYEIVSTGGTKKFLVENQLSVTDISEITQFPEVLGGRVKTLHPHVHMGLLATSQQEHQKTLEQFQVKNIDLLVCNLYPFEKAFMEANFEQGYPQDLVEEIDIGGVTLLRAAAKNFERVTTLCHPIDYDFFIQKNGNLERHEKMLLAQKAFSHTSYYDSVIANSFLKTTKSLPNEFGLPLQKHQELRYGENPHQKATWYKSPSSFGLHHARQLQGKELSYNNLLDLHACCEFILRFEEPTCVAVKHNNPCGVAEAVKINFAIEKTLQADPVSVFGGIIATNRELDGDCANLLNEVFLECILAPSFTPQALEIFSKKKNLRLLEWPEIIKKSGKEIQTFSKFEIKSLLGGYLLQETDQLFSEPKSWKIISGKPEDQVLRDLVLAEKIVSQLKSNAIAIVEKGQSIGLGMGQVNRVDAVEQSIVRMKKFHPNFQCPVLASDAFFPFPDSIELIAQAGIQWIIQPGGSLKDEEVIAAAKMNHVNLILTGVRHFKH